MKNKGSILVRDARGRFITMDEWRRRRRERKEKGARLKWSLVGIAFIMGTMYLLYWMDEIAEWMKGVMG